MRPFFYTATPLSSGHWIDRRIPEIDRRVVAEVALGALARAGNRLVHLGHDRI
jgi:hypothetical protein